MVAAHCGVQAELARGEALGGGGEGFEAGGGGGVGGGRVEPFAGALREADLAGVVVDVHDDGGAALGPADEAGAEEERPCVVEGVDGAHVDCLCRAEMVTFRPTGDFSGAGLHASHTGWDFGMMS